MGWGGKRKGAGRPALEGKTERVTLLLPLWQIKAADKEAKRSGRTRNEVLRDLLARGFERIGEAQ